MDQHDRPRKKDSDRQTYSELSVHEVSDAESGYDADIETLRPDAYEEAESEPSEDAASSTDSEERSQDELVRHMNSLSCNSGCMTSSTEDGSSRGRKRRSTDAFGSVTTKVYNTLSDNQLEVTEVADDQESKPLPKRVRHRALRIRLADNVVQNAQSGQSGPEEIGKVNRHSSTTPLAGSTATESSPQEHVSDSMDLG